MPVMNHLAITDGNNGSAGLQLPDGIVWSTVHDKTERPLNRTVDGLQKKVKNIS